MKHFLTYLTFLITLCSYSQTDGKIVELENQKKKFELEVQKLTDSINGIDLKIAQLKSKKFMDKIKDSSLTAIARKGAKLKKDSSVFADIITIFKEDKEVIILDYKEGYFEVCQGSLCGYMSEIWIKRSSTTSEFTKSKETERKLTSGLKSKSISYSSSLKSTKSSSTKYKTKRYRSSKSYYRGPRGGCYYINSNGNKSYVSRSLCN
ncbi:hypothetical protein [Maribacter ulvicola]|uniref:SH3 domain-containing protein n=1 Tax=Maribacter ulvicola TaxID=228959 RepID=A0A1N6W8Z5_9FLAO|nr:hypothetical protein [Maribacter ulvicola]SIQ86623.1 hypothetical protein SAMN05421797_1045 [Maribacter ulvicola]